MLDPIPISVANLLLDGRNPRLSARTRGQRRIIRALVDTQWHKLLALAKDIVEYGRDPSDLFLVMRSKRGRYVVLDGNRRIAALKLLENPSILDGSIRDTQLRTLKKLSEEYDHNLNDEVLCVQVRDRAEADHWIELKHTAGHKGAGPERWSTEEGGRFSATRRGVPASSQTQALDFLAERGDIDQEFRSSVPTTTLGRLLGTPVVREMFGLGLDQGTLRIASGHEDDVADLLLYVIGDLSARRITVRGLDSRQDRIDYAESLPEELLVRRPVGSEGTPATSADRQHPTRETRRRKTSERLRLIPNDADLHISDSRLQNIEQELRKLSLSQYPNAAGVLLRVFLELSANDYIKRSNLNDVDERSNLNVKLKKVTESLADDGKLTNQEVQAIEANASGHRSIFRMHQLIHNQHLFPSPGELRAEWSSLQSWFEAVWPEENS